MSIYNDFNDLGDLGKISQRWKNGPKDPKQQNSGTKIQKQNLNTKEFDSGINQTPETSQESSILMEGNNPWKESKLDKENLKSINNVEILPKKSNDKQRTRNHAPQVIDEDTEQFKIKLEHLLLVFKTEATSEFMQMKRSMLDDQKQTIQSETERYLQLYEEKSQELQDTKILLSNKVKESQTNYDRSEKLAGLLGQCKTNFYQTKLKQNVFQCFKANKSKKEQKQFKKKLSSSLRKRLLSRFIFGQWKIVHQIDINNKKDQIVQEQHRYQLDELVQKFQKEQQLMEQRLKEASSGLDEANRLKQGIQENLKRAFMRGVCALNYEAMSVIGGQQIQGNELDGSVITQSTSFVQNLTGEPAQEITNQIPAQTVQFYNQNRIESNDHKWKGAPLIGNAIASNQQPLKENTNPIQSQNFQQKLQRDTQDPQNMIAPTYSHQKIQGQSQALQMSIQNLVQLDDGLLDKSIMEDDEGKVIKINLNEPSQKQSTKLKGVQDSKKSLPSKNQQKIKPK